MVSTHMRGAVIPHLSIKVFPTTFTLRRGYTVSRFMCLIGVIGTTNSFQKVMSWKSLMKFKKNKSWKVYKWVAVATQNVK